jgi:hypothetical protein
MANIRELILSIESDALTFDEKLAALTQVEETLVAMQQQEEDAVQENVDLIVEAIKVMQEKVDAQVNRIADFVPEKGEKGDKGERGLDGRQGVDGKDGRDGINGRDGKDGVDGISVVDAKIDFDGSLIITLSTGKELNVGEVVAPDLAEKIKLVTSGGAGTVLPSQTGNSGKYLTTDGSILSWGTVSGGGGGGSGTVTSVAATVPTGLSVAGSPITTSGTLAISYASGYSIPTNSSQTNWNTAYTDRLKWDGGSTDLVAATARTSLGLVIGTDVLAPNGSAANLTSFPTFNQNTTGTASNVTGVVAIVNGGTGQTTQAAALTALAGTQSSGKYLRSNGTNTVLATIVAGDVPTLNQDTTGSAATLTTARGIYGNNFDGSAALTQIIASTYGGTGNGFTKFSGATTAEKTYTLPDATTTILTTNAAVTGGQGGTGQTTYANGDLLYGVSTNTLSKLTLGTSGYFLTAGASAPQWTQTLPIANGGTGQTGKTAAFDALSPATTKGDLIAYDGTDNIRIPVGTDTYVLTADSTQASGLAWAAASGGGLTQAQALKLVSLRL